MPNVVIVDSAPLVALFDGGDQHHQRVVDWFRQKHSGGCTTVAVLTEVSHMLRFERDAQANFLRWVYSGALEVVDLSLDDLGRSIEIMEKHADLPADFADATLVAIADRMQIREVLTLDRDFQVYRYRRRYTFKTPLLNAR